MLSWNNFIIRNINLNQNNSITISIENCLKLRKNEYSNVILAAVVYPEFTEDDIKSMD